MKVLKKYIKVVLCFLALALCSVMYAIVPSVSASAALSYARTNYQVAISAIKLPKTVSAADGLKIPVLDAGNIFKGAEAVTEYTIRVTDPTGTAHDYFVGGTNEEGFFAKDLVQEDIGGTPRDCVKVNAQNSGKYKIVYIVKDSASRVYFSQPFEVTVTNVSYELDFSQGTTANSGLVGLIKPEVAVGDTVVIPSAYANVVGGNTKGSADDVEIKLVDPDGNRLVLDAENSAFKTVDGKMVLTASKAGTYRVTYTSKVGEIRTPKSFEITATEGYVAPTELKIKTKSFTWPTIELGKKGITLPKLTVSTNKSDNVEYNTTKIVIQKRGSNVKQELAANTYTFDMTKEAFNVDSYTDLEGSYDFIYYIEDAYGNTTSETFNNVEKTYTVKSVSGSPKVYFTYNYAANTEADDIDKTADTELKSEYGYTEVIVPAMYAEDQIADSSDLLMYRVLQRNNGSMFYVDNVRYDETNKKLVYVKAGDQGHNYALAEVAEADRETYLTNYATYRSAQAFKFTADDADARDYAGTYTVYYHAVSKTYSERTTINKSTTNSYKITVTSDEQIPSADKTVPTIEITNFINGKVLADENELLSVKITSTDAKDTRLNNVVVYTTATITDDAETIANDIKGIIAAVLGTPGSENVLKAASFLNALKTKYGQDFFLATEEKSNEYSIDFAGTGYTGATVMAISLNDSGNVAVDTKTVKINETNETDAPTFEIIENKLGDLVKAGDPDSIGELNKFLQTDEVVNLPTVKFTDTVDKSLTIKVQYYVLSEDATSEDSATFKPVTSLNYSGNNEVSATLKPSEAGIYYVAYSAMDDSGNVSVVYFTFKVVDTSKPVLTINAKGDDITQTGNTISASEGATIDFEAVLRSADGKTNLTEVGTITISKIDTNGKALSYYPSGKSEYSYTFETAGTYAITFSGSYYNAVDDVTLTANDKILYVNITKTELAWKSDFSVPETAELDEFVYLDDVSTNLNSVVKVTVKAPGKDSADAEKVIVDGIQKWKFKATTKGVYEITYTATSDDQVLTKTEKIKVGDSVKPVITFNHRADLEQDIVYKDDINYDIAIDRTNKTVKITAKSQGKTIYSYDLGVTLSDKDNAGNTTTDNLWSSSKFTVTLSGDKVSSDGKTITGTGECTITFKVVDANENERIETVKFNVVTKTEPKTNNDAVVGAALIVVSIIVLVGVILFFALTGKKGVSKKSKKNNKVENKETTSTDDVKTGDVE